MRLLCTQEEVFRAFLVNLRRRGEVVDRQVEEQVRRILRDLRDHGTDALLRWARELDGMPAGDRDLEISSLQRNEAAGQLPNTDLEALEKAAQRIRAFHLRQRQESWLTVDEEGNLLGQMVCPLERVGIYVPGGKASYPSSVLMNALPARVAGVHEIIMCSPLSWTSPNPAVLAAAELAGVDRIYRLGGAQAIGAMAYGIGGPQRSTRSWDLATLMWPRPNAWSSARWI
jgi:histidinol dehydrogenase